ncbi:MAG: glycerate kinase type-2 family protein [Candidatus Asgardarchaeia archaeon]
MIKSLTVESMRVKNYGELALNERREIALKIVEKILESVDPISMIKDNVKLHGSILRIRDKTYNLSSFSRIFVIGFGKASGKMALAISEILGELIEDGRVIVPKGEKFFDKKIKFLEASHPVPDESNIEASEHLLGLLNDLNEDDLVICLISGGGSALFTMPHPSLSLEDVQRTTELLLKCGANIKEINSVRKHISMVKGGRLAEKIFPAKLVSLVMSDVVGDDLSTIASGPTYPDGTTFSDALKVLERYGISEEVPKSVIEVLKSGKMGKIPETPKPSSDTFRFVDNFIVANNSMAAEVAADYSTSMGLNSMILTTYLSGEAKEAGGFVSSIAMEIERRNRPVKKPAVVILGGETTVTVRGKGKGGRNQEVALSALMGIEELESTVILSFGTDGIDGKTEAAGALVDSITVERMRTLGLNPRDYLSDNDSNTFFKNVGNSLIITGPTGTNVNDIILCVVGDIE